MDIHPDTQALLAGEIAVLALKLRQAATKLAEREDLDPDAVLDAILSELTEDQE